MMSERGEIRIAEEPEPCIARGVMDPDVEEIKSLVELSDQRIDAGRIVTDMIVLRIDLEGALDPFFGVLRLAEKGVAVGDELGRARILGVLAQRLLGAFQRYMRIADRFRRSAQGREHLREKGHR